MLRPPSLDTGVRKRPPAPRIFGRRYLRLPNRSPLNEGVLLKKYSANSRRHHHPRTRDLVHRQPFGRPRRAARQQNELPGHPPLARAEQLGPERGPKAQGDEAPVDSHQRRRHPASERRHRAQPAPQSPDRRRPPRRPATRSARDAEETNPHESDPGLSAPQARGEATSGKPEAFAETTGLLRLTPARPAKKTRAWALCFPLDRARVEFTRVTHSLLGPLTKSPENPHLDAGAAVNTLPRKKKPQKGVLFADTQPIRGRILRIKEGYNPNSSSIGTIVFAMPTALLAMTVAFGAVAGAVSAASIHKKLRPFGRKSNDRGDSRDQAESGANDD